MSDRIEAVKANLDRIGALEWVRKQCSRDVTLEDILGRRRSRHISRVRHDVWWVIGCTLACSYCEVANLFAVHHSTVHHVFDKRGRS